MRLLGSRGILMLCLFLLVGAVIGGLLGDILRDANFSSFMPMLTKQFTLINLQNIELNLFILHIAFSISFTPSILSLLGLILAGLLFRRL